MHEPAEPAITAADAALLDPDLNDTKRLMDAIDREVSFARILSTPVVWSVWLVGVNIAFFIVAFIAGLDRFAAFPHDFTPLQYVFYTGMKVSEHIAQGQWWRLVSSMFVHLDIMHIGFNAYGLWTLGPLLEKFYGGRRFMVVFMVSGIVGAAASYFFTAVPSGGASGAIYGLVGALAVFGMKFRAELPPRVSRSFTTGMAPWVILSIGIGFLDAIPFDNAAHLGGLISGGLVAAMMRSELDRTDRKKREGVVAVLFFASLIAMAATAFSWSAEVARCIGSAQDYAACYPERLVSSKP